MSGELGADDRLVAFMQYLRVLVVVLVTPIGIALFFGGQQGNGDAAVPTSDLFADAEAWVWTAALAGIGGDIGRVFRFLYGRPTAQPAE